MRKISSMHRKAGTLLMLGLALGCGDKADADKAATDETEAAAAALADGIPGRVTAITGPGGVRSPGLAEGTFLGKGARLEPGQIVETPKGTLAEFELDAGAKVRLNEETSVALPGGDHPGQLVVTRGEVVIVVPASKGGDPSVASADSQLTVAAGDETVRVEGGEALVRNTGDKRLFSVVTGHAVLTSGERTVELDAGQSIEGPLPAPNVEKPAEPLSSLRPLDDTGWARTFDAAAQMADQVPRGVGSLTARRPGSNKERQRLRLTDQRVTVNIAGRMAHTEVEQAFFNDRGAVLEGIYRFPLPGDGSISGLSLLVGNTWMVGEVVEKQRGRQIFKQIVDATIPRDPALLEWERGNMFKLRIFPIPGRGERRVRLSYTQVMPVVGGKLRYRYPLGGTGATDVPIDHFEFTMNIDGRDLSDADKTDLVTPMLALDRRDRDGVVELHTEREKFLPTFDLGVDIPIPEEIQTVHTSTHLDKDGQAYFMATVQPQFDLGRSDAPVHYAFVLDRSHSTTPELWTVARGVVDAMTEMMDADDRFTVLACDSACDEHPDGLQAADTATVDRAQRFLDDQDLAGASDLGGMLVQAREALDRGDSRAQKVVVYLGDGAPTSGEMAADALVPLLAKPLQDARVMAVALGSRSDTTTLGAVVDATGGDLVRADARDDLRAVVRELRLRVEVPAARDVEFEFPPGMAVVRAQNVAALRPGDAVILAGKLRHPVSGEITMRARGPEGPIEQRFAVNMTADRAGTSKVDTHLPRTWAALQIQHLTKTQGFEAKDEIVGLSKDYTVMSRFTSLIVLENDAMYREFNVVRAAKNTDKWDGKLDDNSKKSESEKTEDLETAKAQTATDSADVSAALERKPTEDPAPATSTPTLEDAGEGDLDLGLRGSARGGGGTGKGLLGGEVDEILGGNTRSRGAEERGRDDIAPLVDEPRKNSPAPPADPEPADISGDDDDEDFHIPSGSTEAPKRKAKKSKSAPRPKKPASTKRPDNPFAGEDEFDPLGGLGGGSSSGSKSGGWGGGRRHRRWRPPPQLKIAEFPAGSSRTLARVETLRGQVQADPTRRSVHGQLVRTALRAGHPEVLDFARAWAEVDPEHTGALRGLADAMAMTGDPLALRAYESVVEVRPFSDDAHAQLATAFENKGDLRRACSHRRAVVSIDPKPVAHNAALMACLQRAGRRGDADAVRETFLARHSTERPAQLTKISSDLERQAATATLKLHRGAQLTATLTWTGEEDLDIAVVDKKGRRLSTMRPDKFVKAIEGGGSESLTMRRVRGSVFVEVTRNRPPHGGRSGATTAVLELKTPHRKRKITVRIAEGSTRVAKVFWSR